MSTIKVDTIKNRSNAINLPNNFKIDGDSIVQGHTVSATEPSSPEKGDFWWDSANNKLYRYINSEFKELSLVAADPFWGGDRALRAGRRGSGVAGSTLNLDYWDITTLGNAADFGDCDNSVNGTNSTSSDHSASNRSRAIVSRNRNSNNTYDYFTIPIPGNSAFFGNALETARSGAGIGDGTYAVFAGGYINGGPTGTGYRNDINVFTIDTTGNASDFGNLRRITGFSGGAGNASRGTIFGGQAYVSSYYYEDEIQYIPLGGVTGNASDFGDMSSGAYRVTAASDATRAVAILGNAGPNFGGSSPTNKMEYITVDTTGNSTDFGDLNNFNANRTERSAACENETRICISGGETSTSGGTVNEYTNEIMYITTQTTGNAQDFGDLLDGLDQGFSSSGDAS
tara:strand:+ start:2379 stop:3575 length:1197 start_codon:yes stop_codon:yes gene_type:complete